MWAITPKGIGKPVGARAIQPDWDLSATEEFKTEEWSEDMILAEDGVSLRQERPDEVINRKKNETLRKLQKAAVYAATRTLINIETGTTPEERAYQNMKNGV